MNALKYLVSLVFVGALVACDQTEWNSPYQRALSTDNVVYNSFSSPPKTLDPARSYAADEALFTQQIYQAPLQYHYLKRPYTLTPQTAGKMPDIKYFDQFNQVIKAPISTQQVAYTLYTISIRPGILYQPHPGFAKTVTGEFLYHSVDLNDSNYPYKKLSDFTENGTRELIADDYVYEIKRLASPAVQSPILGVMSEYIVGLEEYAAQLEKAYKNHNQSIFFDLRNYSLLGVKIIDRYTYQIKIKGIYPQFIYWLSMPFFSPIPWEIDKFYSQPGMQKNNISFNWAPVGTGAYMMTEHNPNLRIILEKNPNYWNETYPTEGDETAKLLGLLNKAGKKLPFIDKFIFILEKESLPKWNKFLQGYYDVSGIANDSFDQAISVDEYGNPSLTHSMKDKGIRLIDAVEPAFYYIGFNMLDPVVGGINENASKLRQAISIAMNTEEYISIFFNGRGLAAQSPIPPGIFGYLNGKDGINPYIYEWKNNKPVRKSIDQAKRLLAEAGYANGIDSKTGKRLVLHFDIASAGDPESKSRFRWYQKQFKKLGIVLIIEPTEYNRFQDKLRKGNMQLFSLGWIADYPDPENFLFLFYGPNGKVNAGGENSTNYLSNEYDRLYELMQDLPNSLERQNIIRQMLSILHYDAPAIWSYFPKTFSLLHQWNLPRMTMDIGGNYFKYLQVDPSLRTKLRKEWNKPIIWPLIALFIVLLLLLIPIIIHYRYSEYKPPKLKRMDDV